VRLAAAINNAGLQNIGRPKVAKTTHSNQSQQTNYHNHTERNGAAV
jgi:hypothetical protein